MSDLQGAMKPFLIEERGCVGSVGTLLPQKSCPLIVTTAGMIRRETVPALLEAWGCPNATCVAVPGNPSLQFLEEILLEYRPMRPNFVVGIGGGSVLDAAKVLSVFLPPGNQSASLTEVLRRQVGFEDTRLALTLIPTTSGTGAEVTPFATVWDIEQGKKRSLASSVLIPDTVVLDPELTLTLPWDTTLFCALDTCSHAMESLWNKNATDESVGFALTALRLFERSLPALQASLADLDARETMQQASTWAGLAIAVNRTALAHSISYPLTLHYGVPHGLACSFSLPTIAQSVFNEAAWHPKADISLVERVLALLSGLRLTERLKEYCPAEAVRKLEAEMTTPSRAGNFSGSAKCLQGVLKTLSERP